MKLYYTITIDISKEENEIKGKERKFILYFYFKNGMKIGCILLIFRYGL